jgi:signal transduction histidine kinase/CheY-like chemotaxis protein
VSASLLGLSIREEQDVVAARQRARQIAGLLGFDATDQAKLATAVSEIARNAFLYAGGGSIVFEVEGSRAPQLFTIRVCDNGPGISRLDDIMGGRYSSTTGLGLGIVGTRRLMDVFDVSSTPQGTTVSLKKLLPARASFVGADDLARMAASLAAERPAGALAEIRQQNQELLRALDIVRIRQEELERVNRELEDTNRGVVALYAELDERADHLRRVDEVKTRFLSNMTHEFRTPVNSILALTTLLGEKMGSTEAQRDEVYYIRRSAMQLAELVDDLLDLAKVEAGKIEVSPTVFEVRDLFSALRGMLRPLLINESLALVFEEPDGLPPICSDERKLSQILRNFISNALKYTESGEVRVTARLATAGQGIEFTVSDTGIGIPNTALERIFDEFVQVENPLQRRVKGTGLGLPLSKRLAELLGGSVTVESTLGSGSTFRLTLPLMPADFETAAMMTDPSRKPVLVVDDDEADLLMYERALTGTRFQVIPARSAAAATKTLDLMRPAAMVFDIRLHGQDAWGLIARLKQQRSTADIPLLVVSSVGDPQKALALGADAYGHKPLDAAWLLQTLEQVVHRPDATRVLVIDDQEASRFIVREMLRGRDHDIVEAASGRDGLRQAQRMDPTVVLLDLQLGDMDGLDVRDALQRAPRTSQAAIVVITSRTLTESERERIGPDTPVLSKANLTREHLHCAMQRAIERATGRPYPRPDILEAL